VAEAKQSIVAAPEEVALGQHADSKPTPEQKRRWRRAVVPCILFSLAAGFCGSLHGDVGAGFGLEVAALATPAIVAYWLIQATTGRRRLADAVFAVWLAGWLAPCGYIWVRLQFEHSDHPIDLFALWAALILAVSHAAAYGGIRIGMRR